MFECISSVYCKWIYLKKKKKDTIKRVKRKSTEKEKILITHKTNKELITRIYKEIDPTTSEPRLKRRCPGTQGPSITEATSTESQAIRREGRRPAHSPGSHRQDVRRSQGDHSYDLFKYSLQSIYFYTEVKMCADNG